MFKKIFAPLLLLFVFISGDAGDVRAEGWVDTFVSQYSKTDTGFSQGQNRGYWTAGGFNARVNHGSDNYLFSVTPPKLKMGCGGIDAYMGGMSFLSNPDYLVKKGQAILQATPFVAMDIALNVLCPECSTALGKAESIANQLNSLQLNNCKAARALTATIIDPLVGDYAKEEKLQRIQSDFMTSSGINSFATLFNDKAKAVGGTLSQVPDVDVTGNFKGCSPQVRRFLGLDKEGGTFLLDSVGEQLGIDKEHIKPMRGLIGDIYMNFSPKSLSTSIIAPCKGNTTSPNIGEQIAKGEFFQKTGMDETGCSKIQDVNANLQKYVIDKLNKIADKIKLGKVLEEDEAKFIDDTEIPIQKILKTAIASKQEGIVILNSSVPIANHQALRMINTLLSKTQNMLAKLATVVTSSPSAMDANNPANCDLSALDVKEMFPQLSKRALNIRKAIQDKYILSLNEINSIYSFIGKLQEYDNMARQILGAKFGPGVKTKAKVR